MVKSTSCPTAEITGIRDPRMARASRSSLKAQVFRRPAAAADDQHVDPVTLFRSQVKFIGEQNSLPDLLSGIFPLDTRRDQHNADRARTPRENVQNVEECRAVRAGNDTDLARKRRSARFSASSKSPSRSSRERISSNATLSAPSQTGRAIGHHLVAPRGS